MADIRNVVNFLFETGILSKTPRSGFYFLGSGNQSVAEHINRVCFIGFTLAMLDGKVDSGKVLKMCLVHDLPEARTSDLNYVHQKYAQANEMGAINDLANSIPFGEDIKLILKEYEEKETPEAKYAKDADQIELILSLKEQSDVGNKKAETWLPSAIKRLNTEIAKALALEIVKTPSDDWWFTNKEDIWWVNKNKEARE